MSNIGDDAPEMPLAKALRDKEEGKYGKGSIAQMRTDTGLLPEDWRPKFLEILETCGVIEKSAKKAGVGHRTVYRHMENDPDFKKQCDEAGRVAYANLEAVLLDRATNGHYEEQLSKEGIPVKCLTVDNKLGTFIIERIFRSKYGKDPSTVINNNLTVNQLNWSV